MTDGELDPRIRRSLGMYWRRWNQMQPGEHGATLLAAVAIPLLALGLRVMPVRRLLAWAQHQADGPGAEPDPDVVSAVVHGTGRAARYGLMRGNCLSRSLTLLWLLRRKGIRAELCLGTRLNNGQLFAHAWVERDGVALNDPRGFAARFTRLATTSRTDDTLAALTKDSFR